MFAIPLSIEHSIKINRGQKDVFQLVTDFNSWAQWSPWLCQEKSCKVDIVGPKSTVGHMQSWEGQRIGSGTTEIIAIDGETVHFDLTFLKPWKSQNKTMFHVKGDSKSCEVTWKMIGSLPLFMFFFKSLMTAILTNDFKRGLLMLKDLAEGGKVYNDVDLIGDVSQDGFFYVGKRRECLLDNISAAMSEDFSILRELVTKGMLEKSNQFISLYPNFDFVNGKCIYIAALAYKSPVKVPEGLESSHIPAHKAIKVAHKGAYHHLGNAWSTAMSYQRFSRKKVIKAIPPYEVYVTDPMEIEGKEQRTDILVAIKP